MRTDKEMSVLFEQCLQDLTGLGIKPAVIDNVTYKRLSENDYGYAKSYLDENDNLKYCIVMSNLFMDKRVSESVVRGTMFHELLHTVDGCNGHGGKWNELAQKVEAAFPDCPVLENCANAGLPIEVILDRYYKGKAKYILRCNQCGEMYFYRRITNSIFNYHELTCECGGGFDSVEIVNKITASEQETLTKNGIVLTLANREENQCEHMKKC